LIAGLYSAGREPIFFLLSSGYCSFSLATSPLLGKILSFLPDLIVRLQYITGMAGPWTGEAAQGIPVAAHGK